jgi:hypothetical protein
MQRTLAVTLAVLAFTFFTFAHNDLLTFKAEATSAFVWGEDHPPGTVSSSIRDPATGNAIHKLSHEESRLAPGWGSRVSAWGKRANS